MALNQKKLQSGMAESAAKLLNIPNPIKKSFAHIDFINCSVDYDHTICTWDQVDDYCYTIESDAADLDEIGYNLWKEQNQLPEIKISVVMMTDAEFSAWFTKHVESTM